ncbi:MAG TPA: cellulase family glycosylhydrolase, partial [Candidatus Nitrosocosmicus sp.]|nr:cellulase family glycosylhydrolase [Candidatus Nitrosocosmicus sp.]
MNPTSETNCFTKEAASTFTKHGKWFCDSYGRFMIFRGVNFGPRSKLFPYLPIAPLKLSNWDENEIEKEIEEVREEIRLLKKIGFNIIRLLIMWKAIEPYPNNDLDNLLPEGKRYLEMLKKIIDLLYENDQYVILDFHQDFANELFGGEGFPDWAIAIDENHKRPNPSTMRNKKWHIAYMTNKSLRYTLESFWKNSLTNNELMLKDYPVRTHLEKTIGQTIKYFKLLDNGKGHPAILGVEPFNEPHRSGIGKRQFEEDYLIKFYVNVNKEIKDYDDKIFLFIEPRADWTVSSRHDNE